MTLALPAGKQEGATVLLLHLLDDRHYRRGQWNAVFLASLHAPGRSVQTLSVISAASVPITSPVRAAVRIRNSSARADTPLLGAQRGHELRQIVIR
jgi:hypothetical protein